MDSTEVKNDVTQSPHAEWPITFTVQLHVSGQQEGVELSHVGLEDKGAKVEQAGLTWDNIDIFN